MAKFGTNSWQARAALVNREPFDTYGSLSATRHEGGDMRPNLPWSNRLPSEWKRRWDADQDRITYVVWSYSTPIAWVTMYGEVVKVDHKWSITTSKHQGMLYALTADGQTANSIEDAAMRERQAQRQRRAEAQDARREAQRSQQAWAI